MSRMLSRRSAHEALYNDLFLALAHKRARHEPVIDLTVSNPTQADIPYERDAIFRALQDPRVFEYEPEPFGAPHARSAAAATLGAPASRVVLTASTSEAYSVLFKLLCDPDDEVLVPQPSYPLFDYLAQFEGVRLTPYRLLYDGAWHIDLDSVRRGIGSKTRAIIVVNPNNPTGNYVKRDELYALAEHGLPIISDEVFVPYSLRPDMNRVTCAQSVDAELVFSLSGLSKVAGLPQMKAAWMAIGGREERVIEVLERMELMLDSYLSVSAPIQHGLAQLLKAGKFTQRAILDRIAYNYTFAKSGLEGSAATLLDSEGGWYANIRLPKNAPETAICIQLLDDFNVYVYPGHFFDFWDEPVTVVSLLTPKTDFAQGIAAIRDLAGQL